jgi:hypothetical protein
MGWRAMADQRKKKDMIDSCFGQTFIIQPRDDDDDDDDDGMMCL